MNNLEIFNHVRSDLTSTVERYKGLVLTEPEDKDTYIKMKEAKIELRKKEIELEKLAKDERQQALEYQRGIISLERELKAITSPLITDYTAQLKKMDDIKAQQERLHLLPDRISQLEKIEMDMPSDSILSLDEKDWAIFYDKARLEYLEKKEAERFEEERKAEFNEMIKQKQEEARLKALAEAEEKIKHDAIKEKEKKEQLRRGEKIIKWLKDNGVDPDDESDHYIEAHDKKLVLFKKVSEFNLEDN